MRQPSSTQLPAPRLAQHPTARRGEGAAQPFPPKPGRVGDRDWHAKGTKSTPVTAVNAGYLEVVHNPLVNKVDVGGEGDDGKNGSAGSTMSPPIVTPLVDFGHLQAIMNEARRSMLDDSYDEETTFGFGL